MNAPRPSRAGRVPLSAVLTHVVLGLGGATMLLPLLWMVSTSLKQPGEVMTFPPEFLPREPVTWTDAETGRELPVFRCQIAGTLCEVARLGTSEGRAEVVVLAPEAMAGQQLLVPLTVTLDGRSQRGLEPVRRLAFRWRNFPDAWNALKLQRNWMAWEWPYRFRLGPLRLGPLRSAGLPIRNAFLAFYLNSLIVTCVVTVGAVFTSSLAAFAFARLRFPGRDKLFIGYLGTMMVPAVVTMIPVFVLTKLLGIHDTYLALILPPMFTAYGTFLLRQFFLSIPTELEDAARIDGCGLWGIYRHVILPLSRPALATLTTFEFLSTWNSFMWPLIVIDSMERKPLMVGLYAFMGQYNAEWTLLMAASLMVMAPVVIVFIVGQRYFVKGIVLSGMK
jgi:multiple sugar transport system permease protein